MSQYIDATKLDAELAKLREAIASGNNNYVSLAAKVAANTTEINRLKGQPAPTPTPEPTPTPDPNPTPVPNPPSGKATDLGMNVSHYRYTNHITVDPNSLTGYRCSPAFAALYSKFPVIRVMNHTAQATARNRNTTWDTRIKASDRANWDNTGLPIEALIETANACNAHIWWNYPQQCDFDFMRRAGTLFDALLNPGLHVYLETPNECWQSNRGWYYHGLSGGDFGKAMRDYALDAIDKFEAFADTFPKSRTTRIVGGQEFNIGVLSSNALQWLDPGDYDAITCAGYFGNRPDNYIDGSGGFNRAFDALDAHAELARSLGKKFCIYECGQHIDVATADLTLVDSADVQDRIKHIIVKCRAVATGPVCFYSGVGRRYPNAPWPIYGTDYKPQGPTASTLGLN